MIIILSAPSPHHPLCDPVTGQHCVSIQKYFSNCIAFLPQIATASRLPSVVLVSHLFFLSVVGWPLRAATYVRQSLKCTRAPHIRGTMQMSVRPCEGLSVQSYTLILTHIHTISHSHSHAHTIHTASNIQKSHVCMYSHKLRDCPATHICSHSFTFMCTAFFINRPHISVTYWGGNTFL